MTAIVTDINEYRAQQLHGDGGRAWFAQWYSDTDLLNRLEVLSSPASFWEGAGAGLFRACFPSGRDPNIRPQDSLLLVRAEAERRGLI